VHIDGKRAFSCQTQMSEIAGGRPLASLKTAMTIIRRKSERAQ
jgi:hypothetical protein